MTWPVLLSGLTLALVLTPAASLAGQDVDSAQAITWLAEFHDACQRVDPIWPESLCGPLMVVDPDTRTAFLNQPDPHGSFERMDGAYIGTLPRDLQVANTAVEWEGVRWTMVMAPSMGADLFSRLRLVAHAALHRIQPALGVTQASPMPGHLDDEWPPHLAANGTPGPVENLHGPGWSLDLNPGWSVVVGEPAGDWKVVRQE